MQVLSHSKIFVNVHRRLSRLDDDLGPPVRGPPDQDLRVVGVGRLARVLRKLDRVRRQFFRLLGVGADPGGASAELVLRVDIDVDVNAPLDDAQDVDLVV